MYLFFFILFLAIGTAKSHDMKSERLPKFTGKSISKVKSTSPFPVELLALHNEQSPKDKVADALGYALGSAAITMYIPIILDLLRKKSAEGVSIATWATNVASFSLALIYPLKKKFAISTYIELLALHIQSCLVVTIICFYERKFKELLLGSCLSAALIALLFSQNLSPKLLSCIQIVRLILDGYSLLPQIFINAKNHTFSYSIFTALMGAFGNGIRIFTTLRLVKDPLILSGYVIGFISNVILLAQYILYTAQPILS
jgi:mannose-P-dolichol utilization defect protein 1